MLSIAPLLLPPVSTESKYKQSGPGIEHAITVTKFTDQRFYPLGYSHVAEETELGETSLHMDNRTRILYPSVLNKGLRIPCR